MTSDKYRFPVICALLAVATIAVYCQVFHNDFVNYDDPVYVTENTHVQHGLNAKSILWSFTSSNAQNWHPITWLSHILNCTMFGLNPSGHHAVSLLLHIANTLLLFGLLKKITGAFWQSAFTAAVFALHPLHIQSVAWVAERKDVLSTLFWLLTMWAYVRYAEHQKPGRYLLALIFFILGLMAKPMLVTLPLILLLLDYWPLKRVKQFQLKTISRLVVEKIPFFILAAASSFITFIVQKKGGAVITTDYLGIGERIRNALNTYVIYIIKTFIPSGLTVYYPHIKLQAIWITPAAILFLAGISLAVLYSKRRYLIFGWLWYVITLVPVIGLIQVGSQARADRYMYIPMIGLLIMISWGAAEIAADWRLRKSWLISSAVISLLALSAVSWVQIGYWRNSFTLFTHALEVTSDNHIAHLNIGNVYLERKDYKKAIAHYKTAVKISPEFINAHYNLIMAYFLSNRFDEAIRICNNLLQTGKNNSKVHFRLANILAKKGLTDEAIRHYNEALKQEPDNPEILSNFAITLADKGQIPLAMQYYQKALLIKPDSPEILTNFANALAKSDKNEQAIEQYKKALAINPDFTAARYGLASILGKTEQTSQAIAEYRKAISLGSATADDMSSFATILAKQGDFNEAEKYYDKAIAAEPNNIIAHGRFGLALAAVGKIKQAIEQFRFVLKNQPDDFEMHYNLGVLLEQQGGIDEAISEYQNALRINPNFTKAAQSLKAALTKKQN